MASHPFRSILWHRLDAQAAGFRVSKLELHRHDAETIVLARHSHPHWQCLVYLAGAGIQEIARVPRKVSSGTLVLLPPRVSHSFQRESRRPALCLVLEFAAKRLTTTEAVVRKLTEAELSPVRQALGRIHRAEGAGSLGLELYRASIALELLGILLRTRELAPGTQTRASHLQRKLRGLIKQHPEMPPRDLARSLHLDRDHLTRRLKQETGQTLGQYRDEILLTEARKVLRLESSVATAATRLGFQDQNYFARWFRKHTGIAPSKWQTGET